MIRLFPGHILFPVTDNTKHHRAVAGPTWLTNKSKAHQGFVLASHSSQTVRRTFARIQSGRLGWILISCQNPRVFPGVSTWMHRTIVTVHTDPVHQV